MIKNQSMTSMLLKSTLRQRKKANLNLQLYSLQNFSHHYKLKQILTITIRLLKMTSLHKRKRCLQRKKKKLKILKWRNFFKNSIKVQTSFSSK